MTAQAGAILNMSSTWDAVDWRTVEDNVRRLQARIVKAVQQKKWNKVKALQHLLTHSASGKLLAVRRVTGFLLPWAEHSALSARQAVYQARSEECCVCSRQSEADRPRVLG